MVAEVKRERGGRGGFIEEESEGRRGDTWQGILS